jgi:hypothetical protein
MRRLSCWAAVIAVAILLVSRNGSAQTISQNPNQPYANRIVNGQNLGQSTRNMNLNPLGINYSDCIDDMVFQFSVVLSGFSGADNMQIWATNTGDCTDDTTRGYGATQPTCWLVSTGLTAPNAEQSVGYSFEIPVRALVGPQNAIPPASTLVGDQGPDACTHQPSFAQVPITVWFLPLLSNGQRDTAGSAYQYPTITTDLVGPPPPVSVSIADGDTLFVVNWTANSDADTAGYDVFIDPPPGTESATADASVTSQPPVLYCPEGGTSTVSAVTDGADADTDATTTTEVADAGCFYIQGGGSLPTGVGGSACGSVVLASGMTEGTGVTTVLESDEASVLDETDAEVVSGTGGISTIPCQYLLDVSCPAGQPAYTASTTTLTGEGVGSYTIKGLTNGKTYTVAVAAVDGSGNVGTPSTEACDYPAPVNDFFKNYSTDGGKAGGGYCALEAVGMAGGSSAAFGGAAVAGAFVLLRHRRKRRPPFVAKNDLP